MGLQDRSKGCKNAAGDVSSMSLDRPGFGWRAQVVCPRFSLLEMETQSAPLPSPQLAQGLGTGLSTRLRFWPTEQD